MTTVWDYEPGISTPQPDPVTGQVADADGRGGGINLGVFAELAVRIGGLAAQMEKAQERFEAWARAIPGDYQNAQAASYPASGNLMLDLGSPAQGTFWSVRYIIVGGSDITTTPAGTAWVCVMGSPPNEAGGNVNLAQVRDFTSGTFPQRAFYGTHELIVDAGEHLYVIFTSGTSGTQYVASMKAETFDRSIRPDFIE